MTDLTYAVAFIAFACGVVVGAVPVYSAWQKEREATDG